jgi:hypothetical protein
MWLKQNQRNRLRKRIKLILLKSITYFSMKNKENENQKRDKNY